MAMMPIQGGVLRLKCLLLTLNGLFPPAPKRGSPVRSGQCLWQLKSIANDARLKKRTLGSLFLPFILFPEDQGNGACP